MTRRLLNGDAKAALHLTNPKNSAAGVTAVFGKTFRKLRFFKHVPEIILRHMNVC